MTRRTGLRITRIHNQRSGSKNLEDEYVVIIDEGTETWKLSGWLVTDETDQQLRPHVYAFPEKLTSGSGWTFDPGEAISSSPAQATTRSSLIRPVRAIARSFTSTGTARRLSGIIPATAYTCAIPTAGSQQSRSQCRERERNGNRNNAKSDAHEPRSSPWKPPRTS